MNEEDIQNLAVAAEIQKLLPDGYEYIILEADKEPDNGFSTIIRINLKSKGEILKWIKEYESKNQITFRVLQTFEENGQKVIFKKEFRCIQNALPRRGSTPRPLHTGCRAKLTTTLRNINMKRSKDRFLRTHPCEIYIRHIHNHELSRPVRLELEDQFKALFEEGHSPVTALAAIKEHLLQEHGGNYLEILPKNRKRLSEKWANEYYHYLYKESYREPLDYDAREALNGFINNYNRKCGDICAVINDELIIAICSPLMKRIWERFEEITEVIYMHSSGNFDTQNTRVMLFLCPSPIGVLPLGILLLPCEDEESIIEGVRLLKTILPANSQIPTLIIAATADDQKCQALKECFNIEKVLMCRYHIQKSVMRFLWDNNNNVKKEEKINIYVTFINTLNCLTIKEFEKTYDKLHRLTSCPSNSRLAEYFADLRACASLWAMCCRKNQKYDTSDYLEVMFKAIKKNIPSNTFNIAKLFTYITSDYENYFLNKIEQIIECESPIPEKKEKWCDKHGSGPFYCQKIDSNLYTVLEKKIKNIVNYAIDCCSCCVDKKGISCKHKWALLQAFDINVEQINCPVVNYNLRKKLRNLLVNKQCASSGSSNHVHIEHPTQSDDLNFEENDEENNLQKGSTESDDLNFEENDEKNKLQKGSTEDIDDNITLLQRKAIRQKLNTIVDIIMSKLKSHPRQFNKPVDKFIKNVRKRKTEDALRAALETFGKSRATVTPIGIQSEKINLKKSEVPGKKRKISNR